MSEGRPLSVVQRTIGVVRFVMLFAAIEGMVIVVAVHAAGMPPGGGASSDARPKVAVSGQPSLAIGGDLVRCGSRTVDGGAYVVIASHEGICAVALEHVEALPEQTPPPRSELECQTARDRWKPGMCTANDGRAFAWYWTTIGS